MFDDENYILSDSYFAFKWDQDQSINWRNIGALQFDPASGTLLEGASANASDPANDILMNIEQIAYTDLDKERNARWISRDGRQAEKVLQCGMQYYMFAQKAMRERISVLQNYAQRQANELERLQQVHREQRQAHKRYKHLNGKLND